MHTGRGNEMAAGDMQAKDRVTDTRTHRQEDMTQRKKSC